MDCYIMTMPDFPNGQYQQKRASFRGGKPRFYEAGNLKQARADYMAFFKAQAEKCIWDLPLEGPVWIDMQFNYLSRSKKQTGEKTTRPDCDNLAKLVLDCLQRSGWIKDDAQVTHLCITKKYSPASRYLKLRIEPLSENVPRKATYQPKDGENDNG